MACQIDLTKKEERGIIKTVTEKWCGQTTCPDTVLFTPAPRTKDGKRTWHVCCCSGLKGGCKGPNLTSIDNLDWQAGRAQGANRRKIQSVSWFTEKYPTEARRFLP